MLHESSHGSAHSVAKRPEMYLTLHQIDSFKRVLRGRNANSQSSVLDSASGGDQSQRACSPGRVDAAALPEPSQPLCSLMVGQRLDAGRRPCCGRRLKHRGSLPQHGVDLTTDQQVGGVERMALFHRPLRFFPRHPSSS